MNAAGDIRLVHRLGSSVVGDIEDRIKKHSATIEELEREKQWAKDHQWGQSSSGIAMPGDNLDLHLAHYDRIIAEYRLIIADIEARG